MSSFLDISHENLIAKTNIIDELPLLIYSVKNSVKMCYVAHIFQASRGKGINSKRMKPIHV